MSDQAKKNKKDIPARFFTTGERIDLLVRGRRPFDRNPSGTRYALQALQTGTIIALLVAFLSLWIGMSAATEQKLLPYAIVQDAQTGELAFAGSLTQSNLTVTDTTSLHFLKKVVSQLRSVSNDKSVLLYNRDALPNLLLGTALEQLDQMHLTYDPFVIQAGKKTVDLQFLDPSKLDEHTWILRWIEVEYTEGNITSRKTKTGRFTIEPHDPEDLDIARLNAYNLRVVDFSLGETQGEN